MYHRQSRNCVATPSNRRHHCLRRVVQPRNPGSFKSDRYSGVLFNDVIANVVFVHTPLTISNDEYDDEDGSAG